MITYITWHNHRDNGQTEEGWEESNLWWVSSTSNNLPVPSSTEFQVSVLSDQWSIINSKSYHSISVSVSVAPSWCNYNQPVESFNDLSAEHIEWLPHRLHKCNFEWSFASVMTYDYEYEYQYESSVSNWVILSIVIVPHDYNHSLR